MGVGVERRSILKITTCFGQMIKTYCPQSTSMLNFLPSLKKTFLPTHSTGHCSYLFYRRFLREKYTHCLTFLTQNYSVCVSTFTMSWTWQPWRSPGNSHIACAQLPGPSHRSSSGGSHQNPLSGPPIPCSPLPLCVLWLSFSYTSVCPGCSRTTSLPPMSCPGVCKHNSTQLHLPLCAASSVKASL